MLQYETTLTVRFKASYDSLPTLGIATKFTLVIIDCDLQVIESVQKFEDIYVKVGDSVIITKSELIDGNIDQFLCLPYDLRPVLHLDDDLYEDVVDDSPDWIESISQSNNVLESFTTNFHENQGNQYEFSLEIVAKTSIP